MKKKIDAEKTQNFMEIALQEAKKALKLEEVPIGACIIKDGKLVSRGHNLRQKKQNALYHAEIMAIDKACKKLKSWRLDDCEMYVTLEPCPMCAGAIVNARLKKVIYACPEQTSKDGLFEKILTSNRLNHKCEFDQDKKYESEASQLLTQFFKDKRNSKN